MATELIILVGDLIREYVDKPYECMTVTYSDGSEERFEPHHIERLVITTKQKEST